MHWLKVQHFHWYTQILPHFVPILPDLLLWVWCGHETSSADSHLTPQQTQGSQSGFQAHTAQDHKIHDSPDCELKSKCRSWVPRKFTCTILKEGIVGIQVGFHTFTDSQKTTNTGKKNQQQGVWCKVMCSYKESKHQDACASSFTGYSSHCQARTEACGNGYWSQWVQDTAFCWMFRRPEYSTKLWTRVFTVVSVELYSHSWPCYI